MINIFKSFNGQLIDKVCTNTAFVGLFFMVGSFYLAPSYGEVARSFYVLVMLPALIALPIWLKNMKVGFWPWIIFIIPILYLAASTLWVDGENIRGERSTWYFFKPFLFLLLFFIAVQRVVHSYPQVDKYLVKFITIVALISGLLSLWAYLPNALEKNAWPRMAGISANNDINVTAAFFGINIMICVYGLVKWRSQWRWPVFFSLLVSLIVVILSQSKVPLLCFIFSIVWLILQGIKQQQLKVIVPFCLFLIVLAGGVLNYFDRIPFLDRTVSYGARIELWQQAILQAKDALYFGHGVGSSIELKFGNTIMHAHNFIFDTLVYGGIIGVILLSIQMLYVGGLGLVLVRYEKSNLLIVAWFYLGVFFLLTNGQQPLVKPHHIWFFYWIPLAFILSKKYK